MVFWNYFLHYMEFIFLKWCFEIIVYVKECVMSLCIGYIVWERLQKPAIGNSHLEQTILILII